jgi:hypothetical protein
MKGEKRYNFMSLYKERRKYMFIRFVMSGWPRKLKLDIAETIFMKIYITKLY